MYILPFYHNFFKKAAARWLMLERFRYWNHDEDKNAGCGWKLDDWLKVHLSGLTPKPIFSPSLVRVDHRHDLWKTGQNWMLDETITEKHENYLKVCILHRQKVVSKKKKEITNYLIIWCIQPYYSIYLSENCKWIRRHKLHKISNSDNYLRKHRLDKKIRSQWILWHSCKKFCIVIKI